MTFAREKHVFVAVPALNEAEAIHNTANTILASASRAECRISILLINDGSTDGTGQLMDELAAAYPNIAVLHRDRPAGLAASFHDAIQRADAPKLTIIPGDNAFAADGIAKLLSSADTADMIVSYRMDQAESRTALRFLLSRLFTNIMGILFGRRLRDFHSMILYPTDALRQADLRAEGPAYQLEAIVRVLRTGITIAEVPVSLNPQPKTRSSSLRFKTLKQLTLTVTDLLIRR